jgi:hypothetical protein
MTVLVARPRCISRVNTPRPWRLEAASEEVYREANSGDIYEQAVVKMVAGFFRGNPTHLFGVTRFGVAVVYVRAGSIQLNEVAWPQSPGPPRDRPYSCHSAVQERAGFLPVWTHSRR